MIRCVCCQVSMAAEKLERHLAEKLRYHPFACDACRCRFFQRSDAVLHFHTVQHQPGQDWIVEARDLDVERRIEELVQRSLSTGSPPATETELSQALPVTEQTTPIAEKNALQGDTARTETITDDIESGAEKWSFGFAFGASELLQPDREASEDKSEPPSLASEDNSAKRKKVTQTRFDCAICGRSVAGVYLNEHVATHHHRVANWRCLRCPYIVLRYTDIHIPASDHLRRKHSILEKSNTVCYSGQVKPVDPMSDFE